MKLSSEEIRQRFLAFFQKNNHEIIPSASVVPENDPSVLFTTAGMHPLVPYLLGETHPKGKRLANYQKCVRTNDIEEVGDKTHLTFFEMLGNWSLGDYFKKESLAWSYELLTDPNRGFGLDTERMYVTVFAGNEHAPLDEESVSLLTDLDIPAHRIYRLEDNWWPTLDPHDTSSGPTGPDVEFFYDTTAEGLGDMTHEEFVAADDRQDVVEIWNNVFMEYKKDRGHIVGKLEQKNVDTGMGLERMTSVIQNTDNVFDTDLFEPIMQTIEQAESAHEREEKETLRRRRIIADHVRAAVFMIGDGVTPSNTDAGYILRRLIRRAVRCGDVLGMPRDTISDAVARAIIDTYTGIYPYVSAEHETIMRTLSQEEESFRSTLADGIKTFRKMTENESGTELSGDEAFKLFSTYGLPIDVITELARDKRMSVDVAGFEHAFKAHRENSRTGAHDRFRGGLAGTGDYNEVRLHTATHLLHAALRLVLGEHAWQKGSNITAERLRFDFTHSVKLTDEQKKQIEDIVNEQITNSLPVRGENMSVEMAQESGATGLFEEKYDDMVRVYTIGNEEKGVFSREICGGPHVSNTSELGVFRITKEESVSAGVRRIKAVLS